MSNYGVQENMKKYRKTMAWFSSMVCLLLCLGMHAPMTVQASSGINSAEQRVISHARKTFKYRGKYYKVKSEYMAKGIAYLRDEVELTEAEANEAISQMNWNVGEGVVKGYLYEIQVDTGGDPSQEPDEGKDKPNGSPSVQPSVEPSIQPSNQPIIQPSMEPSILPSTEPSDVPSSGGEQGTNGSDTTDSSDEEDEDDIVYIGGSSPDSGGSGNTPEHWSTLDEILSGDIASVGDNEVLEQRPSKEEATHSYEYDMDSGKVVSNQENSEGIVVPSIYRIGSSVAAIGLLAVLIGCIFVLARKQCFAFQTRGKRGHRSRKALRQRVRLVVIGVLAMNFLLVFGILGIQSALFNQDTIITNMNTSGYYRNTYEVLYIETQQILVSNGVDVDALKTIVTYDQYLVAAKNKTLSILKGRTEESTLVNIAQQIEEGLKQAENKTEIVEDIMTVYRGKVNANIASYIYEVKQQVSSMFTMVLPLVVLGMIGSVVTLLYMDRFMHRGIFAIAWASLAATVPFVLGTILANIRKPYGEIYISPDYLYKFFVAYVEQAVNVFAAISIFGGVVFLVLLGVAKKQKQARVQGVR